MILSTLGVPTVANAQGESIEVEAARQFDAGKSSLKLKRFRQAALSFEAAAALRPHPVALYQAALAWEQADRPERAADAFARSLKMEGLAPSDEATAKEKLEGLEASLGTVVVTAPAAWTVQLDDGASVAAPARLHGAAGLHVLVLVDPDQNIERRDLRLETGKVATFEFKAQPSVAPVEATSPREVVTREVVYLDKPLPFLRTIGIGVMSVGAAALVGGAVFGTQAFAARDAYNAGPSREALDHLRSMETATNVFLIAGGVFVVGGAVLTLWPQPEKRTALRVVPTFAGAELRGAF